MKKPYFVLLVLSLTLFAFGFIPSLILNISTYYHNINKNNDFISKGGFNSIPLTLILPNNLKVIFLMLAGAIIFGLSTFINLIYNGFSFGLLVSDAYNSGMPIKLILALTVPHGIFEIPAILISAVAGFKIPYEVTLYLLDKKKNHLQKKILKSF